MSKEPIKFAPACIGFDRGAFIVTRIRQLRESLEDETYAQAAKRVGHFEILDPNYYIKYRGVVQNWLLDANSHRLAQAKATLRND